MQSWGVEYCGGSCPPMFVSCTSEHPFLTRSFNPYRLAYRTALRTAHPDKGGTKERFNAVQGAYAVLSDPAARSAYDAQQQSLNITNKHATQQSKHAINNNSAASTTAPILSRNALLTGCRTQADAVLTHPHPPTLPALGDAIHTLQRYVAVANTLDPSANTEGHRALLATLLMQRSRMLLAQNPQQSLVDCEDAMIHASSDAHHHHAHCALAAVVHTKKGLLNKKTPFPPHTLYTSSHPNNTT